MSDLKVEIIKVGKLEPHPGADQKKQYTRTIIRRNSAICLKCNEEIESKHRHDFVSCGCGSIFVDGGRDYLRRGGELAKLKDTSIAREEPREKYEWED